MCRLKIFLLSAIVCCSITLDSCTTNDQSEVGPPLVVEAYLHVGHPFKVVVSNLQGVNPVDVDNFSLTISNDEETISLHPTGEGVYASTEDDVVKDDAGNYTLHFLQDDREVSSLSVVPFKPVDFTLSAIEIEVEPRTGGGPIGGGPGAIDDDVIELNWGNAVKDFYFPFFENIEEDPELINTNVDTTGGNAPRIFFRGEPTQESSSIIRPMQFQYYGRHNVILFHVNADYAALYKEQDNSSSLNLQPPFTNIVNGMGIFTAIHSDTIVLTVKKPV